MELNITVNGLAVELPKRRADYRCKYPSRDFYQPAFLALFPETEPMPRLFADYNAEIGTAVPWDVYYNRSLRFGIPEDAPLKEVRAAMKKVAPLCAELCKGYHTDWDGNSMVGVWDASLRDKIQDELDTFFGIERY